LPALATQLATCSIALALVKPVQIAFGAATACGNNGDSRENTVPIRLPGNVAICSQRFFTIGSMRVGPRRQHE
jgi:hypothetical protein